MGPYQTATNAPSRSPQRSGFLDLRMAPVILVDYVWVITLYGISAFWVAVLIDGYILPKYDQGATDRTSSFMLFVQVILQVALQGFVAIIIHALLQMLPSPVQGINGYSPTMSEWSVVRNPAVISVILFALSRSLQGRLMSLFRRFDRNA